MKIKDVQLRIVINYLKLDPQKIGKIDQNLTGGGGYLGPPGSEPIISVLFSDLKVFFDPPSARYRNP